jgi:microcystin-dependent protein
MANFLKSLFVKGVEIDPAGAASDQVLKYNGTKFVPGTASTVGSIDDLSDVAITSPASNQILKYNGTLWTNASASSGNVVSDSPPSSPTAGQVWFESDTGKTFIYYDSYWVEISGGRGDTNPVGAVTAFAGSVAPTSWLLCYGQNVSRTVYAPLFAVIGTTYGAGDGTTTFTVPDMRGRAVAGKDDMGGTAASRLTATVLSAANTLGATGGTQTHTMTSAEMPVHTHTQNAHGHVVSANSFASDLQIVVGPIGADGNKYSFTDSGNDASSNTAVLYARDTTATNQTTSITPAGTIAMTNATFPATAGGSSQNVQPTIILNYIIRAV